MNAILQKGTRGSFRQWDKSDYDLTVTMIQKPHVMGGYDMTPSTIVQVSDKVVMTSRFLGLVGSLPPDEQCSVQETFSGVTSVSGFSTGSTVVSTHPVRS